MRVTLLALGFAGVRAQSYGAPYGGSYGEGEIQPKLPQLCYDVIDELATGWRGAVCEALVEEAGCDVAWYEICPGLDHPYGSNDILVKDGCAANCGVPGTWKECYDCRFCFACDIHKTCDVSVEERCWGSGEYPGCNVWESQCENFDYSEDHSPCGEDVWPDKDHDLVCGECKVLVNGMDSKYGGKCDNYCHSIGRYCVGAFEESEDTCEVDYDWSCSDSFGGTSDAICECSEDQMPTCSEMDGDYGTCTGYLDSEPCNDILYGLGDLWHTNRTEELSNDCGCVNSFTECIRELPCYADLEKVGVDQEALSVATAMCFEPEDDDSCVSDCTEDPMDCASMQRLTDKGGCAHDCARELIGPFYNQLGCEYDLVLEGDNCIDCSNARNLLFARLPCC